MILKKNYLKINRKESFYFICYGLFFSIFFTVNYFSNIKNVITCKNLYYKKYIIILTKINKQLKKYLIIT